MEISEVREIYNHIVNSTHQSLAKSVVNKAVRYARLRVDWFLSDQEGRMEMDVERTAAHNALISAYDILSRNMEQSGENN